jgi:hypothetical protein
MTGLSITASADVRRTVEAKTDANGRFVLEWLPPGPVSVDIWAHPLKGGSVIRTVLGSTFDLGEIALAKPGPDYMHRGELGITWKGDGSTVETGSERFEVEAVAPPAAGVLSVGDVVVSVNGIDVTGNNHEAGRTLFEVGPGTALRLGLASGKAVTVVAAK